MQARGLKGQEQKEIAKTHVRMTKI